MWDLRCGTSEVSGKVWEDLPQRVRAPYAKTELALAGTRVPRDTWNPGGIYEDHLVRLNTPWRPIVN